MTRSTTRIAALMFALACSFVCVARADVRSLVNDGKVTWSSNATVIYLNADGTPATAAAYDHLVLKFTDTTTAGSLTVDDSVRANARILVVGGGGAGGSGGGGGNYRGAGGGGGAGGYLYDSSVVLTGGVYTAVVGAGGIAAAAESKTVGGNGQSSLFKSSTETLLEAFGGGGGGAESNGVGGDNLGSGGGGSRQYTTTGTNHAGGICSTGQGNNGGAGNQGRTAGGGGGAGGVGGDGTTANVGGAGGVGLQNDITGESLYYAGGGGGGTKGGDSDGIGRGGTGGGGNGGGEPVPTAGALNTGGGGGGGTLDTAGANGGSGVVIVRIVQLVETQVALPSVGPFTFDKSNHVALDFGIAYTYVEGSGETNATDVGNYSFRVTPGPDLSWNAAAGGGTGERTINWSITKRLLNKPEVVTNLFYDGTNKIGVTHDEELTKYCTFDASSVTNAINGGTYTYSVSLNDKDNTAWKDNTTDDVNGSWTIAPQTVAVPTPKTDLVYDGNEKQGFDSLDYTRYELTAGVTNATAGGAHQFEFSLLGNGSAVNYVWDTDPVSSEPYSGEWIIAAAANSVTKPVLEGWRLGTTPNVPTATALYGEVKYAYVFGEDIGNVADWVYSTSAINTDGVWTVIAMVDATANWTGATNSSQFAMWDDPVKLFRDHVDIRVTPPAGSSETFINFAALVKISEDRFYGFEYARAGSDGNKLMFLDSNKNTLPFEVDTWRTTGESLVWVLIPELPPAGTTITMYWNLKEGRTPPPNNPEEVWPLYSGVWHLNESIVSAQASTALSYDSTTNKNNATPTKGGSGNLNQMVSREGRIGNARVNSTVAPVTQGNRLQTARTQAFNGVFTFSGWFWMNARGSYPRFAGTKAGASGSADGWSVETKNGSSSLLYVRGNGGSTWDDNGNGIPVDDMLNNWVYLTFVYNNNTAAIYSNGKISKTASITKVVDSTQPLSFGAHGTGDEWSLNGAYDEIRITGQALSAQRIAAEYATVVSNDFTVQGSAVSRDDVKRNYWVSLPAMDKTDWDVTETPGAITNAGQLAFCGVTNYIYSVYDPTRTFASTADLTEVGYYRIVFLPDDSEGYEPLSYTIEVHVVEGQPYSDIVGNGGNSGRVLLMNNHIGEPGHPDINYQGWFDADNAGAEDGSTPTYWHHENLDAPLQTGFNLKDGMESTLYAVDGRRLWHIVSCRHGNTFPKNNKADLESLQNYLPFDDTYANRITEHDEDRPANRATTGQLVMQNTTDAVVYSSCFTNGIGTIYFDAVNGWTPLTDEERGYYNLVVEIATNTVEGLIPTDINCVTYTIEKDPETEEVTEIITNWYGNLENCWHAVPVIPYKRDGTTNFEKGVKTEELMLDVENGGTMDNFFRVVVPLDIAGPVRFRIRRSSIDSRYGADVSAFILLDNIIASVPAMSADLVSAGHYDEEKSGPQVLGWELATSVPYPSVGDTANIVPYAKPEFTLNVGDGSTPDTNTFFSSATMHYRWRYLNQTLGQEVSAWKDIALNPSDNFKAIGPLDLPSRPGDVEYWFDYRLQAPYYKYVDYSGASNASIDYTEERGVLTNKLNDASIASGGSDWYFRIRDGKSDYAGLDIVFRRGTSELAERVHMSLAEDHVWRGFVQTKEDQTGTIKYRIEALGRQTEPFAEYAATTNYWRCRVENPSFPVSDSLEPGTVDSWSTLTLDAVTGYVMFQIDDTSSDSMALTVVHADYQDANGWSDALDRKDSLGRGPIFVGTSTTNAYKVGVSPKKQTFDDDFSGWGDMAVTNESWTFVTGLTDIKPNHMYGRKTYETFASDTNGLWDVGQGQWIAKKYRDDRDNAGVALQMEGYGKGYLQFTDAAKAPRGLESISLNARLTQYIRFEDFAYYFGGNENILNLQNYTFVARTAFDLNKNKDFTGNASLSVVANYLPNKGCYEARWEWLGNNNTYAQRGQRLCLYRWNVTASGTKEPELIIARTNGVFHVEELTSLANSSSERFAPLFISVSNDVPNKCTWVTAGIRRCGVALGTKPIGTSALNTSNGRNANWFGVCFKDTDQAKRLAKGSYGVLSANCPGVFARPEFSHTTQIVTPAANKPNKDSFENQTLSQVSNLQNIKNCADQDLVDSTTKEVLEYPGWNIVPGRNSVTYTSTDVNAVIGSAPPQELLLYLGTAGRGDWGSTPYKRITVDGFGGATETVPLYSTKDCSVRIAVGSASSDVAVDTVQLRQWRGGDWNGSDVLAEPGVAPSWARASLDKQSPFFTNYVFTSCWTKDHDILMSAKRSNFETPCAIRAPLMDYMANDGRGGDGYHRGVGLGMISIGYKNAQSNASLLLQIATNAVDYTMVDTFDKSFSDNYWTTITNYNFATMTEAQRSSGVLNTYLGLHSVTGMMRIVVNTNVINAVANVTDTTRFGDVTITSISCNDEPPVDVHSWWGWNLRTVGGDRDSEKMMLLDDFATAPGAAGLSLALNNSVDADYNISKIDVSDRESYIQHKPFVQTPTFTSNVVGEVSFKARKYASSDEPATVVLFGSKDASETDDGTWEKIGNAVFTVTNDWYETYSYKTDPGESYKAFRLAVVGILGIQEDISGGGNARIPGAADPPVRVLLDQLFVSEAVRARMGFKNVGCFKSDMAGTTEVPGVPGTGEQPLCGEAWGVQCEIYGAQLASDIDFDRKPRVRLHWFDESKTGSVEGGVSPWGYEKWKDSSGHKSAWLTQTTDSTDGHYVYRSSQRTSPEAVVGASMNPPRYVQYTLEVVYYTKGSTVPTTNWLSAADWEIPSWYRPLDFNSSLGKGASFAAYNILDNVAPGWAWINEVNVFGLFDDSLVNTDAECQYIEIVQPPEADISGWYVRFLDAQKDNNIVVTNTLATFGMDDLTGLKDAKWIDPTANKVFRVIANQQARTTGKLKYEDGTLDGVWHIEDNRLTNMSGDKSGNTEITAYVPFAIQLVRSSGIVEHEIVAMGTNWWWDLPTYLARYHPTNTVNFLNSHMPRTDFFYVGVDDDGGEPCSLGVFQNNGSTTNDWNNTMDKTPGRINSGNGIVQTIGDHPRPNPVNILVYMTVDGSHILQSLDGGDFTNEMFMLSVPKGSLNGTNVTYCVDPWYVVGSVTTNGVSAIDSLTPTITTQPRQYVLTGVGKGASNNVTVVAMAAPDPRIAEFGVDEDNEYRDAIVDWLEGGTDLFGNPFADIAGGEIKLAEFRTMNNTFVTNMTLTEMYWLDMDPTAGGLALLGGSIMPPPGESDIEHKITRPDGSVSTNIRMAVYMMITNRNVALPAPAEHKWRGPNDKYTHWTPYVIRGREPKSNSVDYDDAPGDWASVTFKPTGRLLNNYTSPTDVSNWEPLRLFVFQPESFTEEGLSRIEIEDPFSFKPFVDWWNKNGPCGIGYFWSIDTRQRQMGVEILRQRNYYGE